MAIKPSCDICKTELAEFGAILLGPPTQEGMVKKYHICKDCYEEVLYRYKLSN